jgi:hypothetical protein
MLGWFKAEAAWASRSETFERLWVARKIGGQEFQGDEAAQFGVLGLVNHTHPAAAQLFDDAVVENGAAVNGGSIGHRRYMLCQRPHAGNRSV